MVVLAAQLYLLVLLVACVSSFGWAMRGFFLQPSGNTPGMRLTRLSGIAALIANLVAIAVTKPLPWPRAAGGSGLYLIALFLFWWAIRTNRRRPLTAIFSGDVPEHIVGNGPYRYIRHPLYCSYILTWLAGMIATGAWWLAAPAAVMIAIYWKAANAEEEKFARSALAEAYRNYCSRTGRFAPNPVKAVRLKARQEVIHDAARVA